MHSCRRQFLLMAFVAALLGTAAPTASAIETPFTAGTGDRPTVAVDGAGTAYIAWRLVTSGNSDVIKFCEVPRGGRACTGTVTLTPDAEDILGRPTVFVGGSTVLIVSNRCCYAGPNHSYLYTSTDGGATFSGPLLFGSLSPSGDALIGPDGALYAISDVTTGGLQFQRAPLAEPQTTAEPVIAPNYSYGGTLGFFGATPVAAFYDISGGTTHVAFNHWTGAGDVNDAATWTAPTPIDIGDQTRLAGGPSGLFLLYEQGEGGSLSRQYLARRFDGSAFGPALKVGPVEIGYMAWLTQDPAGALHALWRRNGSPATLRYAASANGSSWGAAVDLSEDESIFEIRAAVAGDHRGWVVWDHLDRAGPVRVAALEPVPIAGKTVEAQVVKGEVLVKYPAGFRVRGSAAAGFVPFKGAGTIPIGSTVDTTRGTIRLTAAANRTGAIQTADFYSGIFTLKQSLPKAQTAKLTTDLKLTGGLKTTACGSANRAWAARRPSKKLLRRLWGSGKGRYRVVARHSAATVRGTKWLTDDRCDGTLTKVVKGSVSVRDFRAKRTVTVRAGHSYLARAQRAASKG